MQSSLYKTRNKNKLISTDNLHGGCFIQTASIDADKITRVEPYLDLIGLNFGLKNKLMKSMG